MQNHVQLEIIYCNKIHAIQWDNFLQQTNSSSFYHPFGWKEINENSLGHQTFYLAALDNGVFVGILPLVYVKSRLFGKILCSMPFLNYGGPCVTNHEAEKLLLNEACSLVERYNMDYLEIRGLNIIDKDLPLSENKVSLTLELDSDPNILWNAFKSKHRTNIRRVYKNNVSVKSGGLDLLDDFYEILSESWHSLGTPIYNKSYFRDILETFQNKIRIYIAYYKATPIASALNGHHKDTIEGMWAGSILKYRKLQPNYVLYWEMMKDGCENGYKHFHLGRSTI
ncbi:MAG: peptidoglycan bridge formation glycyltransferase FemA/FemB family protein, partial [Gammaproteobacteria bacterium]|nr:peptidoglycan bridge formation glycyltransferase FemA/FemB family protein [Gammaproteobacteria bacterium]